MPNLELGLLKKQMDTGEFHPVYILYGKDKFSLKNAYKRLVKKAVPKDFVDFNYNKFTNDSTMDEIADGSLALPFMAAQKCVLVTDFNVESKNAGENNKLKDLMDSLSETTVLIFAYPTLEFDEKKSAKWKNFFKLVEKLGAVVNFENKDRGDLVKFLVTKAEKYGASLSRNSAEKIIEYCGVDLNMLNNEIHKLSSFAKGREISREDIEELITKNIESKIYELSKAIIGGNYDRAYQILDQLFYQKEKPQVIFAALSKSYVDMYRVRVALQSGKRSTAPSDYDPGSYKGRDFILRNAERDVRGLSTDVLRKSLDVIMETDMKLKGSKTEGRQYLEVLIAKLLLITKGTG